MKEGTKQLLKQAVQSVKNALKAFATGTKDVVVAIHKDYNDEQKIKLNQIQQNQRIEIMNQIRWELFNVICEKKYPYVGTVNVVEDIFQFRPTPPQVGIMLESPENPPRNYMLRQVGEKFNMDIHCFRQWILENYTVHDAWMLYPCIMRGMYIADIKANGIYAVLTIGCA